MTMTKTAQGTVADPLTKADRCDRCGAAAKAISLHTGIVKTEFPTLELLWCSHHLNRHRRALGDSLIWERKGR